MQVSAKKSCQMGDECWLSHPLVESVRENPIVVLMVRTFCFEKFSFKIKPNVDIRSCKSSITVDKDPTEIDLVLFFLED